MNILETLVQLRDDLKTWVTNNLNALNTKIDEKTIPIDSELSSTSTNPVQNKTITNAINNIPRFSGSYNDLTDAPNIAEDDSGNMIIADESGNIIFKADDGGIHTTALSLNGEPAATETYVNAAIAEIPTPNVSGQINAHNTSEAAHEDIRQAINTAKEELSESIVSEAEEWKVVDNNGNIIFSVDAEGAHTTELTLNGEAAATEAYVDNAIANIDFPETDLTGYATEDYVDNAINAIPETDLTDYYTKSETDTAINSAKEELSESIVSESNEWKVVDNEGNIILNVDASGMHTTALTLNGQDVNDIMDTKVASLVDSAPVTLNTLNELASALGDDPNFATTVATEIGKKVDKVDGKGLSTNDFTNEYKNTLDNLGSMAFNEVDPTVPAWAKEPTKPTYTASEVGLGNVNNTSDIDKPVSTATQNALDELRSELSESIVSESEEWTIVDNQGNIAAKFDANGLETTAITADSLSLNGQDVDLSNYFTKSEIDNYVFITVDDIDEICGTTIQDASNSANEVTF